MGSSGSPGDTRFPAVGPLSGCQTALLLRTSALLTAAGVAVSLGIVLAVVVFDQIHLFGHWFWLTYLQVLVPASIATYLDSRLPDEIEWDWTFLLRGT